MNINIIIKEALPQDANYLIGYAKLAGLLPDKYLGYDFAIILARKLDDDIINNIITGPNIEYCNHYVEINNELSQIAHNIANGIHLQGYKALVIEPTIHDEDLEESYFQTLRTDFSHKMAATRAGLGWIGKTALFISEQFGPRVRLATILTNHSLPYCTEPIEESKCGKCNICVQACPAKAANGQLWNIHIDRDEFFNPFACRTKARELSLQNLNKLISLCGKCVTVCPIGKKTGNE
jgi:epoxyqueuosine reductase